MSTLCDININNIPPMVKLQYNKWYRLCAVIIVNLGYFKHMKKK